MIEIQLELSPTFGLYSTFIKKTKISKDQLCNDVLNVFRNKFTTNIENYRLSDNNPLDIAYFLIFVTNEVYESISKRLIASGREFVKNYLIPNKKTNNLLPLSFVFLGVEYVL